MHRSTLALGDSRLSTQKLCNDTLDCSSPHDGEWVTSVGCDEFVGWFHAGLHADGNCLLTDGQVTEASNELLLVELVCCHLHPPHLHHVLVKAKEFVLGCLELKGRDFEVVAVKGLIGELHLEWF